MSTTSSVHSAHFLNESGIVALFLNMILPHPEFPNAPYPQAIARILHYPGVDHEEFVQVYLNALRCDHELRRRVFPPEIHIDHRKTFTLLDAQDVAVYLFEFSPIFGEDYKNRHDDYVLATKEFMEVFHRVWFARVDAEIESDSDSIMSGDTIARGLYDFNSARWSAFYYELVNHNRRVWSQRMYLPHNRRSPYHEINRQRRLHEASSAAGGYDTDEGNSSTDHSPSKPVDTSSGEESNPSGIEPTDTDTQDSPEGI